MDNRIDFDNVLKMAAGRSVNNNIALAYYEGTHYREYNKKDFFS